MRTAREVRQWLEKQPWFESFWLQAKAGRREGGDYSYEETEKTLSGGNGALTLLCAFNWNTSSEGPKFWQKEDNRFRNWFYDEKGKAE